MIADQHGLFLSFLTEAYDVVTEEAGSGSTPSDHEIMLLFSLGIFTLAGLALATQVPSVVCYSYVQHAVYFGFQYIQ